MKVLRALRRTLSINPGMDGLEVIRTVRLDTGAPHADVSREIAHQVAHGNFLLDGERRLWIA